MNDSFHNLTNRPIIASCSFGKDSIVAILIALAHSILIDHIVYVRIMFDDNIPAEYPEHDDWVMQVAIPKMQAKYNLRTKIVYPTVTYKSLFYTTYAHGKNCGKIYGFPTFRVPWCNSKLKMSAIAEYTKLIGDATYVVGIAADEYKRLHKKTIHDTILPLVEYGITESMAYDMCKSAGLLSPIYTYRKRTGCWFCHNQSIRDLNNLHDIHPELYDKLMDMESDSPIKFRTDYTLSDLHNQFNIKSNQFSLFGGSNYE